MVAYSAPGDLLIGDTRLDGVIDSQAFIQAAADEIDAAIGNLYLTPIAISDSAANRPSILLLKLINNYIATGRILLTLSRSAEDKKLDSMGSYYVKLGLERLKQIANGEIVLFGATRNGNETGPTFTGPRAVNSDPQSLVDLFYTEMNPSNPEFWRIYDRPLRPGATL